MTELNGAETAIGRPSFRTLNLRRAPSALVLVSRVLVAGVGFLVVYPLAVMLLSVFGTDTAGQGNPFAQAAAIPGLGTTLCNTVVILVVSTPMAVILGSVFAWLNERSDARVGWLSEILPVLPLLLPPLAGAIGWALLGSPTAGYLNAFINTVAGAFGVHFEKGPLNIYSLPGLAFVYTVYMLPHVYLTVAAALRNVDPALEEAARSNGAGPMRTLWKVTLPSVKPAILGGTLLALVIGLALYSVPVILGTGARIDVLAVRIVSLLTAQFPPRTDVAVVLGLLLLVVIGAIYAVQVRVLKNARFATVGGRGQRQTRVTLGVWRRPAQFLMLGYLGLATLLPLIALILVSLQKFWSVSINWATLSLASYQEVVLEDLATQTALRNSLLLGVGGAVVGMLIATMIAYFGRFHLRGRPRTMLNGLTKLPGAMSHVVIGIAFIVAFAGPPFALSGTVLILLLIYIVLYLPQASVSAEGALAQIGNELPEAARVYGANSARTLRRVVLPLMVPGLMSGWVLLFVLMSGDITASVMLAGTQNPVVGSVTLSLWTDGTYPELAALSVVITCATSFVVLTSMALAKRFGRRSARA